MATTPFACTPTDICTVCQPAKATLTALLSLCPPGLMGFGGPGTGRPEPDNLSIGAGTTAEAQSPRAARSSLNVVGLVLALRERCRGLPPEARRDSLRVADPNWRTGGSARERSPRKGGTNGGCQDSSGESGNC